LADWEGERRSLIGAIANVNKSSSGGIEDLSAIASLVRHRIRSANRGLEIKNDGSVGAAWALLKGSVGSSGQDAWAVRRILSQCGEVIEEATVSYWAWAVGRSLVDTEDGALAACWELVNSSALSFNRLSDVLRANIAASADLLSSLIIVASALIVVKADVSSGECGIYTVGNDGGNTVSSNGLRILVDCQNVVASGYSWWRRVTLGGSWVSVLLNRNAALARLEESVGIAASTILLKREINLSHTEDVLVIAIAVVSSATSSVIDVEARTLLSGWVDGASGCGNGNLCLSSAAWALQWRSVTVGSVDWHTVARGQIQIVIIGFNRASNSSAIANIISINTREALALGKANGSEWSSNIAEGSHGSGVSVSNAASARALVSAETLISRNTVVRVVEDSKFTSECVASAVHAGFVCCSVDSGITARAEWSSLRRQANFLSNLVNKLRWEAASAFGAIANATIARSGKTGDRVLLVLVLNVAVAGLLNRSISSHIGAWAVALSEISCSASHLRNQSSSLSSRDTALASNVVRLAEASSLSEVEVAAR